MVFAFIVRHLILEGGQMDKREGRLVGTCYLLVFQTRDMS